MKRILVPGLCLLALVIGCSKSDNGSSGSATTNYSFGGKLTSVTTSGLAHVSAQGGARATTVSKTITHVMAISPSLANPERYVTEIGSDGTFNLGVAAGRPYVLVFIAAGQSLTGPDMIAGIFKMSSNDLDTLAPVAAGSAALGDVSVSGTTQLATISTTPADLLSALGISSAEATFLGSIDDLSLRAANPDVDGNGVIDALENKSFSLDWHVRANTKTSGNDAKFSDVTNVYLPADSTTTLSFNLASGYAVYPSSFYNGTCPLNNGVDSTMTSGCSFDVKNLAGSSSVAGTYPNDSMSGGGFSSMYQWGPDYNMTTPHQMPGSNGTAVRMVYGFPNGSTLTYWNVKTRTVASLTADGTVMPFIKINTAGSSPTGVVQSIDYKWMKLSGGSWTQATTNEVALLVNENGAFVTFYTLKNGSTQEGFSFKIPRESASGTIAWDSSQIMVNGSSAVLASATTASFCSSAVSYDDKLGLRIFAGSYAANTGVTPCP
jgi:hypothetical protein